MMSELLLHTLVVSVALTAAASAAERLLRLWHREARVAWGTAMALSVALPAMTVAQSLGWLPRLDGLPIVPDALTAPISTVLPEVAIGARRSSLDTAIAALWITATFALVARFAIAARSLHKRRRGWRSAVVDGQSLLLSPDAGPAVVGFRRPAVVIPEWVLELDASLRALVLRHEREHLERGDSRLLLVAVGAAVAVPWNVALWYQLFRLRAAVELDCDRRVLRAHPNARRYGSLLLAVAQRADRTGLLAPALTESPSLLRRRISAMASATPSHRGPRSLLLGVATALLTIVACEMERPGEPPGDARAVTSRPVYVPAGTTFMEFQVESAVTPAPGSAAPRYPDALRSAGVEGEVLAQFVVGPDGLADVETFKVLSSSNDLFTTAVRTALPNMKFNPAKVGGRTVKQLVQQPFTFSIRK